jgi:hypothetical protein
MVSRSNLYLYLIIKRQNYSQFFGLIIFSSVLSIFFSYPDPDEFPYIVLSAVSRPFPIAGRVGALCVRAGFNSRAPPPRIPQRRYVGEAARMRPRSAPLLGGLAKRMRKRIRREGRVQYKREIKGGRI